MDDLGDYHTGSTAPQTVERSLEKALGSQIRRFRRQQDLSITELASAAGISNGMMSKIENGAISASLSTLQSISKALQVSLSALFASFEERQDCSFVPKGQGLVIERRGTKAGHIYELLGHVLRGEVVVEPYLITLDATARAHTGFRHTGIEILYILEGELLYRHGSEVYLLRPGDTLVFDATALHGPEDMPVLPARYLSIIVYPRGSD